METPKATQSKETYPASRSGQRALGIHLIGAVSSLTGQGVICRAYIKALLAAGVRVRITDLDPGGERGYFDHRFDHLSKTNLGDCYLRLGLLVTGAVGIPPQWEGPALRKKLRVDAVALNVWWELDRLPRESLAALGSYDAILAPTRFIEDVLRDHQVGTPILYAPVPHRVPETMPADRSALGVPESAVLVLASFDPASDPARKNPFGMLEAFKRASEHVPDLHLLMKITNPRRGPDPFASLSERLKSESATNPRIHLLDATLPETEALSLLLTANIYLSLHKAEGLGLGMLESMQFGRPVITTAYSGNMSFMDENSACLVGYKLVAAQSNLSTYQSVMPLKSTWAEPDLGDAVRWLVELGRDPDLRKAKGELAARAAGQYLEAAERLEWFSKIASLMDRRHPVMKLLRDILYYL
jgi:glycosyltransferase involved in cell wall biosynthesis